MIAMNAKSDMHSQEISRRRRAISLALEKVLDNELARQGTQIWQNKFSDKPVLPCNRLFRVCTRNSTWMYRGYRCSAAC